HRRSGGGGRDVRSPARVARRAVVPGDVLTEVRGCQTRRTGNRKQETGNRKPEMSEGGGRRGRSAAAVRTLLGHCRLPVAGCRFGLCPRPRPVSSPASPPPHFRFPVSRFLFPVSCLLSWVRSAYTIGNAVTPAAPGSRARRGRPRAPSSPTA